MKKPPGGGILEEIKIKIKMLKNPEVTKNNLNILYNLLISEKDERSFFVEIYDYVDYIFKNKELSKVIKKINDEETKNKKRFSGIASSFKKELTIAEKDIIGIANKSKLKIKKFEQNLETLKTIKDIEKKDFSNTNLIHRYAFLTKTLNLLHSNGIKKEIDHYYTERGNYDFSKFYDDYVEAVETFEDNRKMSLWGCWDKLTDIYSAYSFMETRRVDKKEGDPLLISNALAINEGQESKYLDIEDVRLCVKRIHKYLLVKLPVENIINQKIGKENSVFILSLTFNNKTREIKVNGIFLSRPSFNGANHSIFEHLYENIGNELTKESLEKYLKMKITSFNSFLNDIKIKKTLRKYLVSYSKKKIILYDKARVDDLTDIKNVKNELKQLEKK